MTSKTLKDAGWVNAGAWLPPELVRRLHQVAPPVRNGRAADGRSSFIRRAIANELDRIEDAPCPICGRAKIETPSGFACPDTSDAHDEMAWYQDHPEEADRLAAEAAGHTCVFGPAGPCAGCAADAGIEPEAADHGQ
jgi:hypothetical protein